MRADARDVLELCLKLFVAGAIGAVIGFERRSHHKPIGVAGMIMVAIGSATYMLLAENLMAATPVRSAERCRAFCPGSAFWAAR